MTAPAVPRGTSKPTKPAPRPVASLDDILLELVDIDDNVRDDIGELDELAASIAELGLLSPVKVTTQPDGRYRLVYGQRRVLACRQLGRLRISAIVEPASDVDAKGARRSIEQLAENLQRKDLNPIEEAVALQETLAAQPGLTHEALADMLAMSRPWVSNTLGLLEAAPAVQAFVRDGHLTASHAKVLRSLAPKTQIELAKEAVERRSSVHALEDAVERHKSSEEWRKQREAQQRESDKAQAAAWTNAIEKKLGKQPKDARIEVHSYYGSNSDRVQGVVRFLTSAGFTNVKPGSVASRSAALGCDCVGWKVDTDYGNLTIVPGCFDEKHQRAKTKADEDKRRGKYAGMEAVQKALKAIGPDLFTGGAVGRRLFAEMTLWHALGYRAGDWSEKHGGKRGNPWAAIVALSDPDLGTELGKAVAESFRDNYGYHIPWAAVGERIGIPAEEPAPKPVKGKKAAAT